jgi:hypothetical protein
VANTMSRPRSRSIPRSACLARIETLVRDRHQYWCHLPAHPGTTAMEGATDH